MHYLGCTLVKCLFSTSGSTFSWRVHNSILFRMRLFMFVTVQRTQVFFTKAYMKVNTYPFCISNYWRLAFLGFPDHGEMRSTTGSISCTFSSGSETEPLSRPVLIGQAGNSA